MLGSLFRRFTRTPRPSFATPALEQLDSRELLSATPVLAAGVLTVNGSSGRDNIRVSTDRLTGQLVVYDFATVVGTFAPAAVNNIVLNGTGGDDILTIDPQVGQAAVLNGGDGNDILKGGSGVTTLNGGPGRDKLTAGAGQTTFDGDGDANNLFNVKPIDVVVPSSNTRVVASLPVLGAPGAASQLTTSDVDLLLRRAAGASASEDAIITIVDRNGNLLGVRVEGGVAGEITGNLDNLVYAVDGSLAKARTAAFFASNAAPLTSRTVQFISQTTMTQREIESYPSIPDPNSTQRGPGFVAPIGIKNHFPPNVMFTPQVDLFAIEHTNRDSILHPGRDGIKGTADDVLLPARFNIDPAFVPAGQTLPPPESYGRISMLRPNAQSRGIATLPGGIPIYKDGNLVGGIGVFFPGTTGFATEENSALDARYNPNKLDRSMEAEYIAFAAVGGLPQSGLGITTIAGIDPVSGISLPTGRIDLVGITLDIFGPGGRQGPNRLFDFGKILGVGNPNSGANLQVDPVATVTLKDGQAVPEGWLVTPHDGVGITGSEVQRIIENGIAEANKTRAAIRLPLNSSTRMVFAVTDLEGNVVGLYRMPDATVFSLDVAVAKARNVTYYASQQLQPSDQLQGVPVGTALTNRSFRFLALPRYPEGIDGAPPGPFSILNDGGVNPLTGLNVGPSRPASAYQSVQGYDAFHPGTNFRDPGNIANQNGIVFFPGSAPLYRNGQLIGGFGVSGDGVDQDDVVTAGGSKGFEPPSLLRIDQTFVGGIRVPYQKFNRNPQGGVST